MITICVAIVSIAGCAANPRSDGGIVGTGNSVDCQTQMKKSAPPEPLPEECKTLGGASR